LILNLLFKYILNLLFSFYWKRHTWTISNTRCTP